MARPSPFLRFSLPGIFVATALALSATHAAEPEAGEPPKPPGKADELLAGFTRETEALTAERNAAAAGLLKEYAADLDKLSARLREEGKKALAMAALAERARVVAGKDVIEEAVTSAPFEVLSLRSAHLEKARTLERTLDAKAAQRAAGYLASLEKLAADLQSAGDPVAAAITRALLDAEKGRLPKASAPVPKAATRRTSAAGGEGGGAYEEVAGDGALLTGLVLHSGNFAGHHVIVAVQPIFRTEAGSRTGKLHGSARPNVEKIEAAEGYAVGGLNVNSGDRVDGLSIVFMKIKPGGLDPADAYTSDWIGGKGGGDTKLGSGAPVVGIFGGVGVELDSLGLIELVPAAPAKGTAPVHVVTKENPAAVSVVNISGEPLTEAASAEAGKWMRVPEPLRGARIFSSSPIKHIGVADFKAASAGRVYLACNYEYQGNRGGSWSGERWMPEQFVENGWSLVQGLELVSWENRTFVIFTKELKAGESGRLRCNKYEPPYFITFQP